MDEDENKNKKPEKSKHEQARALVAEAIRQKKIFVIQGIFPAIRKTLKNKGWIEKDWQHCAAAPSQSPNTLTKKKKREKLDKDSDDDNTSDDEILDYKQLDKDLINFATPIKNVDQNSMSGICARLLKDHNAYYYWIVKKTGIGYKHFNKNQILNYFPGCSGFTTKSGVLDILRDEMKWACDDESLKFFPRCYKLSKHEEKMDFLKDYKITAAISVLKIFIKHLKEKIQESDLATKLKNNILMNSNFNIIAPSNTKSVEDNGVYSPTSSCSFSPRLSVNKRSKNRKMQKILQNKEKAKKFPIKLDTFEFALNVIKNKIEKFENDTDSIDDDLT